MSQVGFSAQALLGGGVQVSFSTPENGQEYVLDLGRDGFVTLLAMLVDLAGQMLTSSDPVLPGPTQ